MKFSQMLLREDFYKIHRETVEGGCKKAGATQVLYFYPALNAIVPKRPGKAVVAYLCTEYHLRGAFFKRLALQVYVRTVLSLGGLFAAHKETLCVDFGKDTLVYPCNRKIRIFSFDAGTVQVLLKAGFSRAAFEKEIAFRSRRQLPDFVLPLLSFDEKGYTEAIIDGRPLARITKGFEGYRQAAYEALVNYAKEGQRTVTGAAYGQQLLARLQEAPLDRCPFAAAFAEALCREVEKIDSLTLGFSHGDFQAGNIWIENKTEKIYIIDWESYAERSLYYDKALLFDGLRSRGMEGYLALALPREEMCVVLLEELCYRLLQDLDLLTESALAQLEAEAQKGLTWLGLRR